MTVEKLEYPKMQETLYFEKLENGLEVFLLPKPGFSKTYATFATRFGSIDHRFIPAGSAEELKVPDGIAHFLEHKMFEEPDGDVFSRFAARGASANAYTSFDRTVYLFSAADHVAENLRTLLDFVQNPYFTDENVEKEKGIIIQEIEMYRDNPDWRVYFGLIESLYQRHPVHIDIAGTAESVRSITKELLYECYRTFYHPSNMMLFAVGGFDPEAIMELVRANQAAKSFGPGGPVTRIPEPEPMEVRRRHLETHLPVSLPKCLFGFKDEPADGSGDEAVRRDLTTKLMLDALLGPSSDLYQELYADNLISDNFSFEYQLGPGYAFSVIGGETRDPGELERRVCEHLYRAAERGIDAMVFERTRKKRIGSLLRMLNSPEAIAAEFIGYRFRGGDLLKAVEILESLTLADAEKRLREHAKADRLAVSVVRSKPA